MQEISKFLVDNWRVILDLVVLVLSFIFLLVKKRPIDDVVGYIYEVVPMAIVKAEQTQLKGADKLAFCISKVTDLLKTRWPELNSKFYIPVIQLAIETILITPQKKGVRIDGEKKENA